MSDDKPVPRTLAERDQWIADRNARGLTGLNIPMPSNGELYPVRRSEHPKREVGK